MNVSRRDNYRSTFLMNRAGVQTSDLQNFVKNVYVFTNESCFTVPSQDPLGFSADFCSSSNDLNLHVLNREHRKSMLFSGFKAPIRTQVRLMWFCAIVSTLNHMLDMPFPCLSCVLQEEQNNPNVTIFRKDVIFMKPQL